MDKTRPIEEMYRTLLELEEADWIEAKALRGDSYLMTIVQKHWARRMRLL